MPTANPATGWAAAVRTVALDAAPVIAAVVADLPTNRGPQVTFASYEDTVATVFDQRLTTDERDIVLTTVTRYFDAAGWGYAFHRNGIHLTHPAHLTFTGVAGSGPAALATALDAFVACMGAQDTIGELSGILACPEAAAVADLLQALGHTDRASAWRTRHAAADPDTECALAAHAPTRA